MLWPLMAEMQAEQGIPRIRLLESRMNHRAAEQTREVD